MSFSNDMDDKYEKLLQRLKPPREAFSSSAILFKATLKFETAFCKPVVLLTGPFISVVIDNEACDNATLISISVESSNNNGILLEVVQVLTDLNLMITKAYISSDGDRFMDVVNVMDLDGNKVIDDAVLDNI